MLYKAACSPVASLVSADVAGGDASPFLAIPQPFQVLLRAVPIAASPGDRGGGGIAAQTAVAVDASTKSAKSKLNLWWRPNQRIWVPVPWHTVGLVCPKSYLSRTASAVERVQVKAIDLRKKEMLCDSRYGIG